MREFDKVESAVGSIPVQCENDLLVGPSFGFVGAPVPNPDLAGAILPRRDDAFKVAKCERMVLDLNGQTLEPRLFRNALWQSPTLEDTVSFEAEVKMMRSCMVFLNHKS